MAPEARWFAFLDSDDVWPSDFLQRTLAALQVSPEAVAVTSDRRLIDVSEGHEIHVGMAELAINPTRWLFVHGAALASASVFRAELIRQLHGFKPNLKTGQNRSSGKPFYGHAFDIEADWTLLTTCNFRCEYCLIPAPGAGLAHQVISAARRLRKPSR